MWKNKYAFRKSGIKNMTKQETSGRKKHDKAREQLEVPDIDGE